MLLRTPLVLALALSLATPGAVQAQFTEDPEVSPEDAAAYLALSMTPAGALAPIVRTDPGTGPRRMGFRLQFGHFDDDEFSSRNNYALGLDLPVGRATLGLTAGMVDITCDDVPPNPFFQIDVDCKMTPMFGGSVSVPLASTVRSEELSFTVGGDLSVGYATGDVLSVAISSGFENSRTDFKGSGLSVVGALPMSLVLRGGTVVVVPHLRPGLGYGRATIESDTEPDDPDAPDQEETNSGIRFMLGGGVSFLLSSGIGIHVGLSKIFVEDSDTMFGVGISWR